MKMKKILNKDEKAPYYIPPKIKSRLNKSKLSVTKKDWDRVYIIDGNEGSGKSLLGLQLGFELDSTLNLDRITFTAEEFSKAIDKAEKFQCIIFDEGFNGLSSTGSMSKLNKLIVRKLMECRQKNLFIIIILPTIFMLQKYVAIFRSKALFHVYATKKGVRGYYKIYNEINKKKLYLTGNKFYSYKLPKIKKSYRFYGKYPINEIDYRAKKHEALITQEVEEKYDRYTPRFAILCQILKQDFKMTYQSQMDRLNELGFPLAPKTIYNLTTKFPLKTP